MTSALAERMHAAFVEASGWTEAPTFAAWPDKGAAWFALANARDEFLAPPGVREPYDHELRTPVEKRFAGTTEVIEELPTSLHIRPRVAGDLCLPECAKGGALYELAIQAKIHGVSAQMLDDRIDPVDTELSKYLIAHAGGNDAAANLSARGSALMPEVPEWVTDNVEVWQAVASAMFVTQAGDRATVACRTPGLGTLTIGPYRNRHKRIWEDTARESNEWSGRQSALADMTGKTLAEIHGARVEDITRAWSTFEGLKKNATEMAMSIFLAQHFSPSTDGSQTASTTGPTPD